MNRTREVVNGTRKVRDVALQRGRDFCVPDSRLSNTRRSWKGKVWREKSRMWGRKVMSK